jgi:hypothetical protein
MKVTLFYFYDAGIFVDKSKRVYASTIDWRGKYQGDRVFIKKVEIDAPDCDEPTKADIANSLIATLNDKKKSVLAECHEKVSEIEEEISNLLCLDNKEA